MNPNAPEFEHYCFLRYAVNDLARARSRLSAAVAQHEPALRYCLLECAVIAYGRPFSGNKGAHLPNHRDRYRLPADCVPVPRELLHRELCDLRNQLVAHTDVAHQEPKVMRVMDGQGVDRFWLTVRVAEFPDLIERAEEIDDLIRCVGFEAAKRTRAIEAQPWFASNLADRLPMGSYNAAGRKPGTYAMPVIVDVGLIQDGWDK